MNKVEIKKSNQILHIILNRPQVHNALDVEMIEALREAFALPSTDLSIRAVLVTGKGKSFCAGADLEYMRSMVDFSLSDNISDAAGLFSMFESGLRCPVPVVVKVQGKVMGGAIGLVAIADYSIAESGTQFCFSEVRLGLVPAVISPFVLRKMKNPLAREWMLTGQFFSADQALTGDLIQFVGTSEEGSIQVERMIELITSAGPEAVRETKSLITQLEVCNDWREIKDLTTRVIAERRVSEEGQEGIRAFFEKRSPKWKPLAP